MKLPPLPPLRRDYWGPEVSHPYARAMAAYVAAPALASAAVALLALIFYLIAPHPGEHALNRALETFSYLFAALFTLTLAGGTPLLLGLWALQKRSIAAFAAAGVALGLVWVVAAKLSRETPVFVDLALIPISIGVLLLWRTVAGVRAPTTPDAALDDD